MLHFPLKFKQVEPSWRGNYVGKLFYDIELSEYFCCDLEK